MYQAFLATHYGHDGEGSGCTVVNASSERLARHAVMEYLRAKPEGYRQCQSANLLEIEPYEDSHMGSESVDNTTPGVVLEYRFTDDTPLGEIIYFGFPVDEIADELDRLQEVKYEGRGVSCVQTLIFYLRRKDYGSAKAVARNEGDKIRNHEDVVAVLKRIGFWSEIDFSKWS